MTAKKKSFVPFANEADVRTVGRLSLENRLDRVTVSGDVDLTADQTGLAAARDLLALLQDIVTQLEGRELPAQLPAPQIKQIDNPFA
jgi:hypothetical protein